MTATCSAGNVVIGLPDLGGRSHVIGVEAPHALVPVIEGVDAHVPMRLELVPRFEDGLTVPHFRRREDGVIALAGAGRRRPQGVMTKAS